MRKDIKVETILLSPVSRVILSGLSFKKQQHDKAGLYLQRDYYWQCELLHFLCVRFWNAICCIVCCAIFKITLSLCVYYKLFSNCKLNFDYPFYSRHYDNFYYYFIFYYIVFRFLLCVLYMKGHVIRAFWMDGMKLLYY